MSPSCEPTTTSAKPSPFTSPKTGPPAIGLPIANCQRTLPSAAFRRYKLPAEVATKRLGSPTAAVPGTPSSLAAQATVPSAVLMAYNKLLCVPTKIHGYFGSPEALGAPEIEPSSAAAHRGLPSVSNAYRVSPAPKMSWQGP